MVGSGLGTSSFSVVTFIVAPALLTNASSVLAMSTINRMLRTRDRMAQLYAKSEEGQFPDKEREYLLRQVGRVENQALLLLRALRAIYVALGSFSAATLVTLIAAVIEQIHPEIGVQPLTGFGIVLGATGVCGLIFGSVNLFNTTRLSIANIAEEAASIRARQALRAHAEAVAEFTEV